MTMPRVAFFGSPDFAVPTLTALIESPYRPCVVVTQPDRPAGRGRTPRPSAAYGEAAYEPPMPPIRAR